MPMTWGACWMPRSRTRRRSAPLTLVDPEALAVAARFGQDVDSAVNSDAPDRGSYRERMGFIYTLLRAHQCDPALFGLPPGTPPA